ncbi:exo-beta-N-acetylmuramidase NamZ domain-containing protein, partial [Streptomyces hirsutus]|uniref:exo-beta-N-acetylmuramidase NamZ domain-containing protein n=1 Tax=Streptomyces hirsutus TaxID=35620 RepID=UPI003650B049
MRLSRRSLFATTTATLAAAAATPAAFAQGRTGHPEGHTESGRAAPAAGRRGLRTGFEQLAADGYAALDGERVGVVTNPTGITRDVRHIVDVMHADDRVDLTAVFGPEHGFRGTAQAGGSEGRHDDPATGLPVYDTYLKSGRPRGGGGSPAGGGPRGGPRPRAGRQRLHRVDRRPPHPAR